MPCLMKFRENKAIHSFRIKESLKIKTSKTWPPSIPF